MRNLNKWPVACVATLFLGAAAAQAVPFDVGIDAFSGPAEVGFDAGDVTSPPYVESGATFDSGSFSFDLALLSIN